MIDLEQAAEAVSAGDPSAFSRIVLATQVRFVRMSARILGGVAEAEEVVQDAYLKAYRALVVAKTTGHVSSGSGRRRPGQRSGPGSLLAQPLRRQVESPHADADVREVGLTQRRVAVERGGDVKEPVTCLADGRARLFGSPEGVEGFRAGEA